MNRGSALKWIERLQSKTYELCHLQMTFRMPNFQKIGSEWVRKADTFDHIGVLCDLLDPTAWKINTETDFVYSWHGVSGYIPKEQLKRGKIKHQEFLFVDEFGKQHSLADMFFDQNYCTRLGRNESWHVTDLISKYYEQF